MTDSLLTHCDAVLTKLHSQALYRTPTPTLHDGVSVERNGKSLISFGSNDYLGLAQHPTVVAAAQSALDAYGHGAGASRYVTGDHPLYSELEATLSHYKSCDASVVFGSGYLANLGTIPSLVGKGDLILADKLVHACLLDGARLSQADVLRFPHNDMEACAKLLTKHRSRYRHCLLITDHVFSMDGDIAPLPALRDLADIHNAWLMVDDAHGFGITPLAAPVDVLMGTFSKAAGSYGGYVCGAQPVIDMIRNTARPAIFSTALPPSVVSASIAALHIMHSEPERAERLMEHTAQFCHTMQLPFHRTPIVSLIIGAPDMATSFSQTLEEKGFYVPAIRPPTVPQNTSRLRISFSALHKKEDISVLCDILHAALVNFN